MDYLSHRNRFWIDNFLQQMVLQARQTQARSMIIDRADLYTLMHKFALAYKKTLGIMVAL